MASTSLVHNPGPGRWPVEPQPGGRWILNFGARHLRAAKLAGLSEIPAFIDTAADDYDQIIENEQREGLKPLELALFVQKRLARGGRRSATIVESPQVRRTSQARFASGVGEG